MKLDELEIINFLKDIEFIKDVNDIAEIKTDDGNVYIKLNQSMETVNIELEIKE